MVAMFARYWWAFALQGVLAIAWGLVAIFWPGLTLPVLVLLFGAYALVDGIFSVSAGIVTHDRNQRWGAVVLRGVAGIVIGIVTFFWPGFTARTLLYVIAVWEIVMGGLLIMGGVQLRRIFPNKRLMILSGVASIIVGVILFAYPGPGALSLVWLISGYAIVFGILHIELALRLHSIPQEPGTSGASRISPL